MKSVFMNLKQFFWFNFLLVLIVGVVGIVVISSVGEENDFRSELDAELDYDSPDQVVRLGNIYSSIVFDSVYNNNVLSEQTLSLISAYETDFGDVPKIRVSVIDEGVGLS